MATNIKFTNNQFAVTFTEKKSDNLANYEMYTQGIKALGEVGRIATLKIVEAVARVNIKSLWKLGNSEKTGLPYNSINEWAIGEFGFSKSHVSEMLSVAKQCCDPETGVPLDCLAGYGYTQLLAFTKNPELLLKVKSGEEIEGLSLSMSAKEIKTFSLEDKSTESKVDESEDKSTESKVDESEDKSTESKVDESEDKATKDDTNKERPSSNREIIVKMSDFERWFNIVAQVTDPIVTELLEEWENVLGIPFNN